MTNETEIGHEMAKLARENDPRSTHEHEWAAQELMKAGIEPFEHRIWKTVAAYREALGYFE